MSGRNGYCLLYTSSSRNYDVLGWELFTPDEVRKLDNKKCIIFIRGFDPIMDNKYIHEVGAMSGGGGGKTHAAREWLTEATDTVGC